MKLKHDNEDDLALIMVDREALLSKEETSHVPDSENIGQDKIRQAYKKASMHMQLLSIEISRPKIMMLDEHGNLTPLTLFSEH
ncbi:hypothetical protein BCU68_04235 [Vibrio sp. 10N.286.49.B3]|uniref:hypothetical protein n=1 Tax=Vibrio sp. 10N.286.49.B3 TaxID=1880855 RepID=UPI000C82DBC4|nr:hypothetical protein [Vibrio sp. 10N.286.49.B3]PMH43203.1 hypothetical protein BCU68_04235 [Vibrio sp. 10N.286.49.B3]